MSRRVLPLALAVGLTGCASSHQDREWYREELAKRVELRTCAATEGAFPEGVTLDDGLDEAEVVILSLCRSPALKAEVTRIDVARAGLSDSRRLANPQLSMMAPFGPVNAIATLALPLESLWQLPRRTKVAALEADATAEAVLMRALDLVRDARLLHVELGLAVETHELQRELAEVGAEAARIAAVRAAVGDIGVLEESVLNAEARSSLDRADFAATEVEAARARLVAVLGLSRGEGPELNPTYAAPLSQLPPMADLLTVAHHARPDARAAEATVAAANARVGWERTRAFALSGLVESQWGQSNGASLRVGGRADLPIFNQNQGAIAAAKARVEQAKAESEALANTIALEVALAHQRWTRARRSFERFEGEILPQLEIAAQAAESSYRTGDQPYLVVLDALGRLAQARLRLAELRAELRRAHCELERSVGSRLSRGRSGEGRLP